MCVAESFANPAIKAFCARAIGKANIGTANAVAAVPQGSAPASTTGSIQDLVLAIRKEEVRVHIKLAEKAKVWHSSFLISSRAGVISAVAGHDFRDFAR